MAQEEADQLQDIIEKGASLPVWGSTTNGRGNYDGVNLDEIELYVAMRDSDRKTLSRLHPDWTRPDRQYRTDSLPERISAAFSDLLFGEAATFSLPDKADQEELDSLIEANQLDSELKRWAEDCSAEGEQWWRVFVNEQISDRPVLEMNSRLDVVPLWLGRHIGAVAFFQELARNEVRLQGQDVSVEVFRHVEIQTDGLVRNLLYKGTVAGLGNVVPLTNQEETAELDEEWNHGLDIMLAGRVVNKLGRKWRLGVSHYRGIRDQLLDLNEARTIMAENARLAAKKRIVVPANALDEDGNFDASEDVLTMEAMNESMSEDTPNANQAYAILEYKFDSGPLIAHIKELEETALTRVGLTVSFVNGDSRGGRAESGVSLRTKLIPTKLAAQGLMKHWATETPMMINALMQVDALPKEQGGLGNTWHDAKEMPTMAFGEVLPEEATEKANRHATLVTSELESLKTAIADLHPEWDENEVQKEIDQIKQDRIPFGPGTGTDTGGGSGGSGALPGEDPTPPGLPAPDAPPDAAQTGAEQLAGAGQG